MENYFAKFPKIYYNNKLCTDITRNVKISEETRKQTTLFYPYELKAGTRADTVANAYYDDPTYDWLIYLINGIVDPYYAWYLREQDFESFILDKYGSLENAQRRVKQYRLNANNDDVDISVDFYNANLPLILRKYYVPNFGMGSRVVSYKKRQESWMATTNKILKFTFNAGNTHFQPAELLTIKHNQIPVGNCEVISSNSTVTFAKNISGNTSPDNTIDGHSINQTDVVVSCISDEEFVYWSPYSYFDYEYEKNESRKNITLLDANYALETAEQLRIQMKKK